MALPDTSSYAPTDQNRHPSYVPKPPSMQALPQQEPGTRPARALPYDAHVDGSVSGAGLQIFFRNTGKAAAVFQVRSGDGKTGPWTYTVGAGAATSDSFGTNGAASYDFLVYGPNGFLRAFAGSFASGSANLAVNTNYDRRSGGIVLVIQNLGSSAANVNVFDAYTSQSQSYVLQPQQTVTYVNSLQASFSWYDLTIRVKSDPSLQRQLAGHVETGSASVTDPAIGR